MAVKQRTPMPMQDPAERARNFSQVAIGYTGDGAGRSRTLPPVRNPSVVGCPVSVRSRFIGLIKR